MALATKGGTRALGLLIVAALVVFAPAATAVPAPRVAATTKPKPPVDPNEVWRLHPSRTTARLAKVDITVSYDGNGSRGALMLVEDGHKPVSRMLAGAYNYGYAELANDRYYPYVYDNQAGVESPDCTEPVVGYCSDLGPGHIADKLTFTFRKAVYDGRPMAYNFQDVYVGAVNAHITHFALTGDWTITRATNAHMLLVTNDNTKDGIGAHAGNYTVEQFNGVTQLSTAGSAWSEVQVQLPCPQSVTDVPTPQDSARLTGLDPSLEGRPYIPLSCAASWADSAMASGPTTWRLTLNPSTYPANADRITFAQNVNRLVALVVDPETTTKKSKGAR